MARSRIKVRNPHARSAWTRKAGPMTAPNAPKGGSQNWREHLPEEDIVPEVGPCEAECECHTDRYYDDYLSRQFDEEGYIYQDDDSEE